MASSSKGQDASKEKRRGASLFKNIGIHHVLIIVAAIPCLLIQVLTIGLPQQCPSMGDVQAPKVKNGEFNITGMEGVWYELAMKDSTQPRFCSCQTSTKELVGSMLMDNFTIDCVGDTYFANLSHAVGQQQNMVDSRWNGMPLLDLVDWNNLVLDYEESTSPNDNQYEWVLEFQCVQGPRWMNWGRDWIAFYGMNFYAKDYRHQDEVVPAMEARSRERGLGPFLDNLLDLHVIDHKDCPFGH